jgi:hypothetical protein
VGWDTVTCMPQTWTTSVTYDAEVCVWICGRVSGGNKYNRTFDTLCCQDAFIAASHSSCLGVMKIFPLSSSLFMAKLSIMIPTNKLTIRKYANTMNMRKKSAMGSLKLRLGFLSSATCAR